MRDIGDDNWATNVVDMLEFTMYEARCISTGDLIKQKKLEHKTARGGKPN